MPTGSERRTTPNIKVYFGGKTFRETQGAIGREVVKYAGRTGSDELGVSGRSSRFFSIVMKPDEYTRMLGTVLGSSVQAVRVPINHDLERMTLEGHRINVEVTDSGSLLYNQGQLQVLSHTQVWAVGRALNGQKGAIEVPKKGYL